MPDGLVFAQAFFASMGVSMLVLLTPIVFHRLTGRIRTPSGNSVAILAFSSIAAGIALGCHVLQFPWTWPPANAIERFLEIFVPGTLIIHLASALTSHPEGKRRLLRQFPSLACPLLILYGSIYLRAPVSIAGRSLPSAIAAPLITIACTIALLAAVHVTQSLTRRTSPFVTGLLITLTLPATGIAIMLAGYIKGGAAALPIAGSLVATLVGLRCLPRNYLRHSIPEIAMLFLGALLFIGHFFGRISLLQAAGFLVTPMIAAGSPLPKTVWSFHINTVALRLILLTLLLSLQLSVAWWEFSVRMKPLLAAENHENTGFFQMTPGALQRLHGL